MAFKTGGTTNRGKQKKRGSGCYNVQRAIKRARGGDSNVPTEEDSSISPLATASRDMVRDSES
jgi:hypothetical protein